MARRAEGWKLQKRGDSWHVRFTHAGKQRRIPTGCRDIEDANRVAAEKYAEVVTGRRSPRRATESFERLIAAFVAEYEKDHAERTAANVIDYARAHWLPFFGSVEHLTKPSVEDYTRERLTQVTRSTVRKELSALRRFVAWVGLGVDVPSLPSHGFPGKRSAKARKEKATIVSAAIVEKLLAAMPEQSLRRHGGVRHPVRAFFRVLWETGLRESTLFRIEAPKHYRRGAATLFISRDIDKAHSERNLPLTAAARAALDSVCPLEGLIFPRFDLRGPLERACAVVGLEGVSSYDLRHSRLTHWANTPGAPLGGVQYAAGHKSIATTARYVQGQQEAAEMVILGHILGQSGGGGLSKKRGQKTKQPKNQGAKEGS